MTTLLDSDLKCTFNMKEMGKPNHQRPSVCSFPPPQYFDKMEATATLENGTETQEEMTIADKPSKESEKAKMSREDACYDRIDETQRVNVKDGFMTYTKHFKYLGSYISYSLQDDYDIKSLQQPPKRLEP